MLMREFRNTGLEISVLGLGCMRLPVTDKDKIDVKKAQEMVDYAYANGINYFDTAYMYHNGESESFIGPALKKYPRESYYLATKMPVWEAKTKADLEKIFQLQLDRCQADYFDFYLCHALTKENFQKTIEFDVYGFLQQKRKEGKIKYIGFSFHDVPEVLQTIVDTYEWDFAQIQLNYLDWEMQNAQKQYEILKDKGIPCIVMEPVRGGTLANPCEKANELFKQAKPENSIASWAIRFAATLPNVLTVLSGMSNMEQLKDNIKTLSDFQPLTQEDEKTIKKAVTAYKEKDTVPCTGCRYCMDCPFGVDIPTVFSIYNKYAVGKEEELFLKEYRMLPEEARADHCQECGGCMEHCPQAIKIPEKMKMISEFYKKLTHK